MLVCLLLLAALAVIWAGERRGRAAYDSLNYHEKAIRQFAYELPAPNLRDYLSATTPGYHLVLAVVGRGVGSVGLDGEPAYDKDLTPQPPDPTIERERRVLQIAGLCFSLALVYILGAWSQRTISTAAATDGPSAPLLAVALCLPLLASPYFFQSAAWLLPDNSAWLGVTAVVLLALRPVVSQGTVLLMGAALLWLVMARQVHAWCAGVIWASAWLSASLPSQPRTLGPLLAAGDVINRGSITAVGRRLGFAVACTLPAAAAIAALARLWGGQLVPPTFTAWHGSGGGGVQPATPAFILGLIALAAPFLASWWLPGLRRAWVDHRAAIALAATAGFLLAVATPSGWSFEQGRFGGVWNLYRAAGTIGGRSIALALLAPLGAVVVVSLLAAIDLRRRWIMLAALAGFAAANAFNPQLWQRYHEPFALLWLIIASSLAHAGMSAQPPGHRDALAADRLWKPVGPVVLSVLLAASGWLAVVRTPPQVDQGYRPGHIETPPVSVPQTKQPG